MRRKVLLIDGNNFAWKAFGQAPLVYEGQRTEMIKIGLNVFRSYLNLFDPDYCGIVWDGGRDERRVAIYPKYKRPRRSKTDVERAELDQFFAQLSKLKEILVLLGFPTWRLPGREADDVVYNLIKHYFSSDKVIVVSSDEDMYQLFVTKPDLTIYSPIRKAEIYKEDVEKEFGFSVENFLTYRSLVGDPSDNVSGIYGIGEKAARDLIYYWSGEEEKVRDVARTKRWAKYLASGKGREEFDRMRTLLSFLSIPLKEIELGFYGEENVSLDCLYEKILEICNKFGFNQIVEKYLVFAAPFERYFLRMSGFRRGVIGGTQ